eukprot:TRINITY_DN7040_c0_g1_i4.p1 TRINITY_DN7040_c0_g1~~TRINITY_DN7040_c0_g1_i4.p1  ORF type:complete len:403 (+),score=57.37 TRINITY_DN7040_c0_g1_i4:519-1727(+)
MAGLSRLLAQPACVLCEVQLKGNRIGDAGAQYLANALHTNTTIKVLELQSNGIGPIGTAILCNALYQNTTVHALNFNDNGTGDEGAEAIAALLMNNTAVTTVGISGNLIEKPGAAALARALACNNTLTGLDLGANNLGNGGVSTIAAVLRVNTSLVSLDIHGCSVQLQGVLAITQALMMNTTLRHLDAGANFSRNQGAYSWAKLIRKSTVLTRLCLTDNEIGREGAEYLLQAMKCNRTLRNFQFGGQSHVHPLANRIPVGLRRAIHNLVVRNKRIFELRQQQTLAAQDVQLRHQGAPTLPCSTTATPAVPEQSVSEPDDEEYFHNDTIALLALEQLAAITLNNAASCLIVDQNTIAPAKEAAMASLSCLDIGCTSSDFVSPVASPINPFRCTFPFTLSSSSN